jgi:LuxR family maltose regulon positive regulatory protein
VCGAREAEVVLVLRGPVGAVPAPRAASKAKGLRPPTVVVEGGALPVPGSRELPSDCGAEELATLLRRPDRLPRQRASAPTTPRLSGRELDVLRRIAQGSSNVEIAKSLGMSPHTARTHVQNILTKLGVSTRAAAVARAHRLALLQE